MRVAIFSITVLIRFHIVINTIIVILFGTSSVQNGQTKAQTNIEQKIYAFKLQQKIIEVSSSTLVAFSHITKMCKLLKIINNVKREL